MNNFILAKDAKIVSKEDSNAFAFPRQRKLLPNHVSWRTLPNSVKKDYVRKEHVAPTNMNILQTSVERIPEEFKVDVYGQPIPERFMDLDDYEPPLDAPLYDKTRSIPDQVKGIDFNLFTKMDLKRSGWSDRNITRVLSGIYDPVLSKERQRNVPAPREQRHDRGAGAYTWKISRNRISPRVAKPTVFSLRSFREWVSGEVASFAASIPDTPLNFISGNYSAQALYYGAPNASERQKNRMLAMAAIFPVTYKNSPQRLPLPLTFGHFTYGVLPPLLVDGIEVFDLDSLEMLKVKSFHRQAPLFRACQHYLSLKKRGCVTYSREYWRLRQLRLDAQGQLDLLYPRSVPHIVEEKKVSKEELIIPPGKRPSPLAKPWIAEDTSFVYQGFLDSVHTLEIKIGFPDCSATVRAHSLIRIAALITTFVTSTSWANSLAALTLYVTSDEGLMSVYIPLITSLSNRWASWNTSKSSFSYQGAGEFFSSIPGEMAEQGFRLLAACGLHTIFSEIGGVLSETILPLIHDFVAAIRSSIKRESATVIAKGFLDWFKELCTRITSCIQDGNIDALWGDRWNYSVWVKEARSMRDHYTIFTSNVETSPNVLETMKKMRLSGEISKKWILPVQTDEYVRICKEHLTDGNRLLSYYVNRPGIKRELEIAHSSLSQHVNALVLGKAGQSSRVSPIMIYLYGAPATGKTVIAMQILKSIARKHGLDDSPSGIHEWVTCSNFQDGFLHTHWAVIMDDVDTAATLSSPGTRSHVDEIIALVNNKPYSVEQADVSFKGKIKAAPLIIIYCSNLKGGRADECTLVPHAFYRRITLHVTVSLLKEYATESGELNVPVVLDSKTHDIFRLEVSKVVKAVDTSLEINLSTPEVMNLSELCVNARTLFQKNLENQTRFLNTQNVSGFCDLCGLDVSKSCSCSVMEEKSEFQGRGRCRSIMLRLLPSLTCVEDDLQFYQSLLVASMGLVGIALGCVSYVSKKYEEYQGRAANRDISEVVPGWFRADQTTPPGIPGFGSSTFSLEDVKKSIKENFVEVTSFDGTSELSMFGLMVSNNLLLVPTHVFHKCKNFRVVQNGYAMTYGYDALLSTEVVDELTLYRINFRSSGGVVGKVWQGIDSAISQFDAIHLYGDTLKYEPKSNAIMSMGGHRRLIVNANTREGDCGLVYVAQHNKNWKIVGMHYAGSPNAGKGIAALFSAIDIRRASARLAATPDLMVVVPQSLSKTPEDIVMWPLEARSEIWASDTTGDINCLGRMQPPVSGSTMKTKVTVSKIDPFLSEFKEEHGCKDYWQLPSFRGNMIDGQWVSPYTNMFATQNHVVPSEFYMRLALADYLNGICDLDCTGYGVLSEEETLTGIPGSYINPVNIKTSVGPPFNRSKIGFVSLDRVVGSEMDGKIWEMVDVIEGILDEESIPSVLGLCTLKDEPVKPGKFPRVFICLPFSINFVAKKYGSAWKKFMRSNLQFFESCVGINMTSADCNKVIHILKSVDPTLTKIYDGDVKAMDKSWNHTLFFYVSLFIFGMNKAIGVEPEKNRLIVLAFEHIVYCCKNDLFRASFNPSGGDQTVELNGIALSLSERYVYYRTHGYKGNHADVNIWFENFLENPLATLPHLDFRENVALVHYGDDNLKAMRLPPGPDYLDIWANEIGMIMTPADKGSAGMVPRCITEVSFLKRKFVWHEGLMLYIPPLDMKSIVRMLCMKHASSLTETDHAAAVLTDAHREMVYHGEEKFNAFFELATMIAKELGISENSYLVLKHYEHWYELMKNDKFQTWSLRTPNAPPVYIE